MVCFALISVSYDNFHSSRHHCNARPYYRPNGTKCLQNGCLQDVSFGRGWQVIVAGLYSDAWQTTLIPTQQAANSTLFCNFSRHRWVIHGKLSTFLKSQLIRGRIQLLGAWFSVLHQAERVWGLKHLYRFRRRKCTHLHLFNQITLPVIYLSLHAILIK